MKITLVFIAFSLIISSAFSQSKKQQINDLNLIIDSLENVINNERTTFINKSTEQLNQIQDLKNQIETKSIEINKMNKDIISLQNELDEKSKQIIQVNNLLAQKQKEIDKLKKLKQISPSTLIQASSVGGFVIGNNMPKHIQNGQVYSKAILGNEGEDVPIVVIAINNQEFLHLYPEYDYNIGEYNDKIGEITAKNKLYITNKGIGVGSSVEEFITEYADFKIWYTYISDRFVIESKSLEKVQFILEVNNETKDEIEKKICLDCEDRVSLSLKDIKKTLTISEIRVF